MTGPAMTDTTSQHIESGTRNATILTQVVQLEAEPAKGRQIVGPIALFWEPEGLAGQTRRALACTFSVCKLPSCSCRDVKVQVRVVDERIFGIRNEGGDLTSILYRPNTADRAPKPWAELTLELDGGRFSLHSAGTGGPYTPHGNFKASAGPSVADVANLVSDLFQRYAGAELLGHLRNRWRVLKGMTEDWKGFDWSWFEPGDTVSWNEAFPNAVDGLLQVGKRWLLPLDRYCVDAGCTCDDVKIEFVDVPVERDEPAQMAGVVEVALSTGEARQFKPAPGMTRLLRAAWKAYSDGACLERLLPDRQKRMREVGKFLLERRAKPVAQPVVAAPRVVGRERVGPNQPCPCGSGVKFKRCCMGR